MFIVIEGGDASGKTTLIEHLRTSIDQNNIPFAKDKIVFLKSPTHPFADIWRSIISSETVDNLTRFLFFRAVAQNDVTAIKKIIASGNSVIMERYFYSTEAFNNTLDNHNGIKEYELRSENHVNYNGLIKPDFSILLDISDEERELRLSARTKSERSPWEVPSFQKPFNEKLRSIAKRENMHIINTGKHSKEYVTNHVISEIIARKK